MRRILKNIYKLILCAAVTLVICFSNDLYGQELTYKIIWKGDSIGYLRAEKSASGSLTEYELESHTKFSMVFSFHHEVTYESSFEDNNLMKALTKGTLNNKPRSETEISYDNGEYHVTKDGDLYVINEAIHETISGLYFNEPRSNKIFSEKHGVFCTIKNVGNHEYDLIKPDKNINKYYFNDGVCQKATIELDLATVYMQRVP